MPSVLTFGLCIFNIYRWANGKLGTLISIVSKLPLLAFWIQAAVFSSLGSSNAEVDTDYATHTFTYTRLPDERMRVGDWWLPMGFERHYTTGHVFMIIGQFAAITL